MAWVLTRNAILLSRSRSPIASSPRELPSTSRSLTSRSSRYECERGSPQALPRRATQSLNVLVNSAGISRLEDLTADAGDVSAAHSIIRTNIVGVLRVTAALLPTLRQQRESTIIATTSGLAFVPFASFPTYSANKAFLHSWLQSPRFQLRHTSVEVLELAPPYVQKEARRSSPGNRPSCDAIGGLHCRGNADPRRPESCWRRDSRRAREATQVSGTDRHIKRKDRRTCAYF